MIITRHITDDMAFFKRLVIFKDLTKTMNLSF